VYVTFWVPFINEWVPCISLRTGSSRRQLAGSSDKFWAFDQLEVKAVWAFLGVLNPWILGN
jgi:hypothetical protein